jgi:hypothetical protein
VLSALAAVALICAASAVVGEALARLVGAARWRGWSPAAGLGVLFAVATLTVKLPGHGATAAILCALLTAAAAAVVWRGGLRRPDGDAVAATIAVLALVLVPFLATGRFGVLGVSFLNDMSAHLGWAQTFQDPDVAGPVITPGYPAGPHSLVAAVASGTGLSVESAFGGLLIAIPLLTAWAVLPLLDGIARWRRAIGATIVATCFLVSAMYAQAAFKETGLVLFLLGSVALLRAASRDWSRVTPGTGVVAGALATGAVFTYSYSGLAWLFLAAAIWLALELGAALLAAPPRAIVAQVRGLLSWRRGPVAYVLGAAALGGLFALLDLGRLFDALDLFGSSPSGTGVIADSSVAHLAGQLSPWEVFGLFPVEDFRFPLAQQYRNGALVGLAVAAAAYGALWWTLRRDLLVPAAAAAAGLIAVYLRYTESPYLTSKGYAIAAPFVILVAVRALLEPWPAGMRLPAVRIAYGAVAAAFCAAALYSGYRVLHGAKVGPAESTGQLREIADELDGDPTLFLGFDDLAAWKLHGLPVAVPVEGFHLAGSGEVFERVPTKGWRYGDPFDFDSVPSADLDRVRYAITTRSANQSTPPPNFRRIAATPQFLVYERRGPTRRRMTLAEGPEPGTVLECRTAAGRALSRRTGWASARPAPIVVQTPRDGRYAKPGGTQRTSIGLPRGRWELSVEYVAEQDVDVEGLDRQARLPANLDRPGPWYRIGEVEQRRPGRRTLTFHVGDAPLPADTHVSELIAVAAVDLDTPPRLVPLRAACGRYVDWYVLGRERPTAPSAAG